MDKGYRLKITVMNSLEPVFREVEIFAGSKFIDLHLLIQESFGLENKHEHKFELNSLVLNDNEKIAKYLNQEKLLVYLYDHWEFEIIVEKQLEEIVLTSRVLNYQGDNLIKEDMGNIDSSVEFDLAKVNQSLQGVKTINESLLKNDIVERLKEIHKTLKNRDINGYQVIKLHGETTTYWVIINTLAGYIIELFENYDDLQQGFYYSQVEGLDHAFCYCHTFLLSEDELDFADTLDKDKCYAAFFNQPGFMPSLIEEASGTLILSWLNEFLTAITYDSNVCEADEIIEIWLNENNYDFSVIFEHEAIVDMSKYDFGYQGISKLSSTEELLQRVCVDVVCLPTLSSEETGELAVYGVVATKDDYLIKPINYCINQVIGETLIDAMIDFFEQYGEPQEVIVSKLNVSFLIARFLKSHGINCEMGDTSKEVDLALGDAFCLNEEIEEMFDDPLIRELVEELEGKSEEEIEAKLAELLAQTELLN